MPTVISMTKEKFNEILLKAAIKVIGKQADRVTQLEQEVDLRDSIIESMSDASHDTSVTIDKISRELVQTQELLEAEVFTNKAFLAVTRMKLREGESRDVIIDAITETLNV